MSDSCEKQIVAAGITGLASLYETGVVSPTDVVETYLARIERYNPELNAFVHVMPEQALEAARASAARWKAGKPLSKLDGVPVAVKANIAVKGVPCHGGIKAYEDDIATEDAEAVTRLRAAGAIILGLLNMEEGALGAKTDNPWYGKTINPHKAGYTPGGSSGGSGAAAAAALCAASLGTDTMGSVRIPSAYCGIYGFKPAAGAVPVDGVMALSPTLDYVGPHTRALEDIVALAQCLSGEDYTDTAEKDAKIGLLDFAEGVEVSPAVRMVWDGVRRALSNSPLAHGPVKFEEWDFSRMRRRGLLVSEYEGWQIHQQKLAADADGFSKTFRELLEWGHNQGREAYEAALLDIRKAQGLREAYWQDYGFLLMPTAPQLAFDHVEPAPANQADFTAIANFAGLPALAIPTGMVDGLPGSVQLVGMPGYEEQLFAVASTLISILPPVTPPEGYGF